MKQIKTPEQMAEEYADSLWESPKYYQPEWTEGMKGFLAGYQAAKDKYEAKIKELETELDNWKHEAIYGKEGL